jgi:Xaa-Pro dipeptidase
MTGARRSSPVRPIYGRQSNIHEIRIWVAHAGADPATDLQAMLEDLGAAGARLGVEYDSYGLTHHNGKRFEAALTGFATLIDASRVVPYLRVTKSEAELGFVRKAAELSDLADAAAIAAARPGADEGVILAAQHNAIFSAGGDYPANEFIIGSGHDALLCRYHSGRRQLSDTDQLICRRLSALSRRDHAHAHHRPKALHIRYHTAAKQALFACEAALRPNRTAGDVFAAHAKALDAQGLSEHRLNACGYSLGAKFTPSWMDVPMFYEGNEWHPIKSILPMWC